MIPYGRQLIDAADVRSAVKVLRSAWLTQGPTVRAFEAALGRYCGARYAVAVSNGTAALHLSYLAADIGPGDEVITTPNTFVATSNMLLAVGAKPVFCDIRSDTNNIDENNIEKLITAKTRAIVPVHFSGRPCAMREILKLAKKYKLLVIEDAAHALGAAYDGKKIGGLQSNMTIFSFHPVKSITTGEGGAIITNSRALYKKLLLLRSHGLAKDAAGFNVMRELGYNYRLTDIQAALGASQLRKLNSFIINRRRVARWYAEELAGVSELRLPLPSAESSWHLYVIRVKNKQLRLPLMKYLRQRGIATSWHYPAVYSHPYYRTHGYQNFKLENMEEYHATSVTIPCYPGLERREVRGIAQALKSFFAQI